MTDLVLDDAVRFAQDEGVGQVPAGQETWHSAGNVETLALVAGSDGAYIHEGLEFTAHDATNDTVTLTAGVSFVFVDSVEVQSAITSDDTFDTTLPHDVPLSLTVPSDTVLDVDAGANDVWIAYATDDQLGVASPGDVYCRYGSNLSAPSHTHVHVGTTDASSPGDDTRPSDLAEASFSTVTSSVSEFVPESEPPTPASGCVRWYDEVDHAFKVKFDDGAIVTIAER